MLVGRGLHGWRKRTMKPSAKVARLATSTVGDARARVEEDMPRVQEALVVAEEGRRKAEAETARLEVGRTSLLLDLKATKDEVSSLHFQASKDKEAMKEEYQKALEVIFAYGYGCCVFKHDICGDHPKVPKGMPNSANLLPLEFFVNLGYPPVQAVVKATMTEAPPSETPKEPMDVATTEDQSRLQPLFFRYLFFCKGALF